MDINAYFSFRVDKEDGNKVSDKIVCVMILEDEHKQKHVEYLLEPNGHYIDGCLDVLEHWLTKYEVKISQAAEPVWIHCHFHRSAVNIKKAFIKVKDAFMFARSYPKQKERDHVLKQKLTFKHYRKPKSYLAQVNMVNALLKLDKVFLTCETSTATPIGDAYLFACAELDDIKNKKTANVIQFPDPNKT